MSLMTIKRIEVWALLAALLLACACRESGKASIKRNRDQQELSSYHLASATGARDGDRLLSEVTFTSGPSKLTMQMKFLIGVPTRLESGTYQWSQDSQVTRGNVTATSVVFLGGQNGPPSIGGTFHLTSEDVNLYEIKLPTTALSPPAPATSGDPGAPPFKTR
jgi:hypothetical protein